jgi:GT2 family glycosyltransferase
MQVSVIIVNYFSWAHLDRCLKCLAAQELPPHRVVIINNGDTDDALSFVKTLYPSYLVIEPGNIGFAAANNLAVAELTDSEWVALLNPDAFPEQGWLSALALNVAAQPQFDMFSARLLNADTPSLLDGEGDVYHFSGASWRRDHGRASDPQRKPREVFSACGAAALFRRSMLIEAGGFDEKFFCYMEDVDLAFRLRLLGYRCLHVPAAVVRHVGSGSSDGPHSYFATYHGHRNQVWTFVKNMPGYLFWVFLPAHIVLNVIALIWITCRGNGRAVLRAKIDALKRLPEVWEERKQIQKMRKLAPKAFIKQLNFWPFESK